MRTVSVVMTYHNRPDQLRNCLRSMRVFCGQNLPDTEVIIVDDASHPDLEARSVLEKMDFDARLISISREEKTWTNPSVPFNRGFAAATGEIVVIQNAEIIYAGDVLSLFRRQLTEENYISMSCYSTRQDQFHRMLQVWSAPDSEWFRQIEQIVLPHGQDQWYHHPEYLPTWYHFTSAITRHNLYRIGGFDERFANGYCFDDNNLLLRIRSAGLTIPRIHPNQGYIIHQWHPKNPELHGGCPLWEDNRILQAKIQGGELPLFDPNRKLR